MILSLSSPNIFVLAINQTSRALSSFGNSVSFSTKRFPTSIHLLRSCSSSTSSTNMASTSHPKNRLQHEKSPYLLQHQSNPVDWYPWSEEAFALAKEKDKPIFLSVGYATCHWCHVMERESFESPSIAKIMNDNFINIKMDREERPDIDRIYMTFVQSISGSGGWPMSVWMTPDLKPFYGGTYYPPDDRYFGRPGFRALLQTISDQYTENKDKCYESAEKIMRVLSKNASPEAGLEIPSANIAATRCIQQLTRSYEPIYGGFSDHPKFPQPVNLIFLMDWALKNPTDSNRYSVVKMIDKTLKEMAKGGIHDHVGQGFARYSVDKKWHVPHFEKMLYDQSQLVVAYANAFLLTKDEHFSEIVKDILTYVKRDLTHPQNGFYSAEDADSYPTFDSKEKKEGAFYVWKSGEIQECLGGKKISKGNEENSYADVFNFYYGVEDTGNCDPNSDPHDELSQQNVLFQAHELKETAKHFKLSVEEVKNILEEGRTVLFNFRNINRPRPGLDSKFVTSWNALMISGYARAGMALSSQEYIDCAVQAMDFLKKYVFQEKTNDLLRSCYRDENDKEQVVNLSLPIFGCVDDFANLVSASIELFHATFDPKYLQQALKLQEKQNELFWDSKSGGYFNSRADDKAVILRMKDDDDGAEPSSNSTSVTNLLRLYSITKHEEFKEKIEKLLKQFSDRLIKIPITLPIMTSVLSSWQSPTVILISGKNLQDQALVKSLRSHLLPTGTSILGIDLAENESMNLLKTLVSPELKKKLEEENPSASATTIYILKDGKETTVSNAEELSKVLA